MDTILKKVLIIGLLILGAGQAFAQWPRFFWEQIEAAPDSGYFAISGSNLSGDWDTDIRKLPGPYIVIDDDTIATKNNGMIPSLWTENGSGDVYRLSDVGIGTSSPSYPLHIVGPWTSYFANGNQLNLEGADPSVTMNSLNNANFIFDVAIGGTASWFYKENGGTRMGGSFFAASSDYKLIWHDGAGVSGTILSVDEAIPNGGYGVGIATSSPAYALDINSTKGMRFPSGTTAQRPVGADYVIRGNSDTTALEVYLTNAWKTIAVRDDIHWETDGTYISNKNETLKFIGNIGTTAGNSNVRLGATTNLAALASGNYNFSAGTSNMRSATSGESNLMIGERNFDAATGNLVYNAAVGYDNFKSLTGGSLTGNVGLGQQNYRALTSGSVNIGLGQQGFINALVGSYNVAFGESAGANVDTAQTTFAGGYRPGPYDAGDTTMYHTFVFGYQALYNADQADSAVVIGYRAGYENTYLSPILFGSRAAAAVDYHAVVGPDYYRRFSSGLYSFNVDQDPTGKDGYALKYNSTGGEIELMGEDQGSESNTTDGSGDITVSHNLPDASLAAVVTVTGTTPYEYTIHSKTASNFKVRFYSVGTSTAATSTAVTFDWIAHDN